MILLALLALALLATGCGTLEAGFEGTQVPAGTGAGAVSPLPTDTPPPTAIAAIPTAPAPIPSATVAPALVPSATNSPQPAPPTAAPVSPTPTGVLFTRVKIYLVAIGDGSQTAGTIGCGDTLVAVDRVIAPTNAPLKAALSDLLSIHDRTYGQSGLYNALYQSKLQVNGVTIAGGVAKIALTGTLLQGGVCDSPRIKAQLESTARQFSTVQSVDITINGKPLAGLLSGK